MRIPTWRLLLTGGAIAVLAGAGLGYVAGSNTAPAPDANVVTAQGTVAPDATAKPDRIRPERENGGERVERSKERWGAGRWLHFARHLVHAEATITGVDGELITLAFDHGTVESVGGGSLTIAESGGGTETVSIDDATIVYVGREDGELADVTVGDEVFVQSRVEGGTLAKRILIVPADAG